MSNMSFNEGIRFQCGTHPHAKLEFRTINDGRTTEILCPDCPTTDTEDHQKGRIIAAIQGSTQEWSRLGELLKRKREK